MRPRGIGVVAVVFGACALLTACGQQNDEANGAHGGEAGAASATAAARQEATTRWAVGYCTSTGELVRTLSTMPIVDPATPESAARTSSELLSVMIDAVGGAIDDLSRLGPAPGADGDTARTDVVATLARIRERAVATKAKIDGSEPNSADSREGIGAVQIPLDDLGGIKFLAGFDATPELRAASEQAPSCVDLATAQPEPEPEPEPESEPEPEPPPS